MWAEFDGVITSLILRAKNGRVDALDKLTLSPILNFDPIVYNEELLQPI